MPRTGITQLGITKGKAVKLPVTFLHILASCSTSKWQAPTRFIWQPLWSADKAQRAIIHHSDITYSPRPHPPPLGIDVT